MKQWTMGTFHFEKAPARGNSRQKSFGILGKLAVQGGMKRLKSPSKIRALSTSHPLLDLSEVVTQVVSSLATSSLRMANGRYAPQVTGHLGES